MKTRIFVVLSLCILFLIAESYVIDAKSQELMYSEDFDSETGEMDHDSFPDSYNSTYSVDENVSMYNEFPNEYFDGSFDDWFNLYNSCLLYTSTSPRDRS